MEANRDNPARSENRDADDAWTPADPDPRDAFDETLPADRSDWEAAADRERQTSPSSNE